MVRLISLIFILIATSFFSYAESIDLREEMYFNFLDLNNDNQISFEEINQALKLIFQLIDNNNDNIISKDEVEELKKIVESLS